MPVLSTLGAMSANGFGFGGSGIPPFQYLFRVISKNWTFTHMQLRKVGMEHMQLMSL